MKSKVFMNFFVLFSSVFMLAGCSLLSPAVKNVNYYDLTYSGRERYKVNCRFELRNFHNISPAKLNLLYTGKNSVIQLDQYNYWVQSPEVMLRRFMLNAVEPAADEKAKVLDASLTVFDFKFEQGKAYNFILHLGLSSVNFTASVTDWVTASTNPQTDVVVNVPLN